MIRSSFLYSIFSLILLPYACSISLKRSSHSLRAKFALSETASCKTHDTCSKCSRAAGCGFCSFTQTCMEGNENGPLSLIGCESGWRMVECNDLLPCKSFETCQKCTLSPRCGWCSSNKERLDAVGCVAMKLADQMDGKTGVVKKPSQWMPPQVQGWCPGGTYQHKYKEQCTSGQMTLKEARTQSLVNKNILRAEKYSNDLNILGDNARQELTLLLKNIHKAKRKLENGMQNISLNDQSKNADMNAYYKSRNETSILSTEMGTALIKFEAANKTFNELLVIASTPGNVTGDDVEVRQKLELLGNVTRDRSEARDAYKELTVKRDQSEKKTKIFGCIAKVKNLILTSTKERYDLLKQEEIDDARVAEVVKLKTTSNSSSVDGEMLKKISDGEVKYEDEREEVSILETNFNVQNEQSATYRALEEQESKANEAITIYNESLRQKKLEQNVEKYISYVKTNETKLDSIKKMFDSIEISSDEAKHLQNMKNSVNNIDLKLADFFQKNKQIKEQEQSEQNNENAFEVAEKKERENEKNVAILTSLKKERVAATENIAAATVKLKKAMELHTIKIKKQENKVAEVQKSLKAAKIAADVYHNRKSLENLLRTERKKSNKRMLKNDMQRETRKEQTNNNLYFARKKLREQERNIYNLKINSFSTIIDRITDMVAGDKVVQECEMKVEEESRLALEKCKTQPTNGPFTKLDNSLTSFNEAVIKEHEKSFQMFPEKVLKTAKDGEEKEKSENKEGAMFARNIARAEAIKGGECQAMEMLKELSKMLGRRLIQARKFLGELKSPPVAVKQSLLSAIKNLASQEQHVIKVEGETRIKCADATSFARQANQEALVAAAMRVGKLFNLTNSTNSTSQ